MIECLCDWVVSANIEEIPVRVGLCTTQKRNSVESSQFERCFCSSDFSIVQYAIGSSHYLLDSLLLFNIYIIEQSWLAFGIFFLIHMSSSTICPIIHLHWKHSHFHRRSFDYWCSSTCSGVLWIGIRIPLVHFSNSYDTCNNNILVLIITIGISLLVILIHPPEMRVRKHT